MDAGEILSRLDSRDLPSNSEIHRDVTDISRNVTKSAAKSPNSTKIISPVASERSFFDFIRSRFIGADDISLRKCNDNTDLRSATALLKNKKHFFRKSGPDFLCLQDECLRVHPPDLRKGLSASDSIFQLGGHNGDVYRSLLKPNKSNETAETVTISPSDTRATIYSSCVDFSSCSSSTSCSNLSPPEPPDGGWGWVVVIAAFFVQMITDGVPVSFGIFLEDLFEDFAESLSYASWVGSFAYGIPLLASPLASFLINKFDCRKVCVVGGFISAIGCALSFFSDSVFLLILTFGVLSGLGSSLSSTAALIIVSLYFDDRRAFATGLSIAGSGIGAFIFAPLVYGLISLYTWRGAMLILSGVFANLIVCGLLMRPIETRKEKRKRQLLACMEDFAKESGFKLPDEYKKSEGEHTEYRIQLLRKLLTNPAISSSLSESSLPFNLKQNLEGPSIKKAFLSNSDTDVISEKICNQDIAQIFHSELLNFDCHYNIYRTFTWPLLKFDSIHRSQNFVSVHKNCVLNIQKNRLMLSYKLKSFVCLQQVTSGKQRNYCSLMALMPFNTGDYSFSDINLSQKRSLSEILPKNLISLYPYSVRCASTAISEGIREPINDKKSTSADEKQTNLCFELPTPLTHQANMSIFRHSIVHMNPLYSRTKLSVFHRSRMLQSSVANPLRTVLSMPELASSKINNSNSSMFSCLSGRKKFLCYCRGLRRSESIFCSYIQQIVDISLFKSLYFNIFLISNLFLFFWCNVTYFFLAMYTAQYGISKSLAAMLFSIMGASDTVGEIAYGWAADQRWSNTLLFYASGVFVCGLSTTLVPLATTFPALVCYCIFGFTMAANDSLCTILVIEFVGLSHLVNGLGFCLFCQGIASILGPPLIGYIIDETASHTVAFLVGGIGVICAALVMVPAIVHEQKRKLARRRHHALRSKQQMELCAHPGC